MYDVEGFQDYLAEEELSENTIEVYVCGVKKYARMFGEITKSNLIAFKKYLTQNFKPQTVNIRITAILTYCKYIGMPMKLKQVKVPKKTHIDNIISMEQFEYLLRCLKKDDNERWYAYILLLGKTGMRISEAIRVKKSDILNGSVDMYTKAHVRTIYFPNSLVQDIMPYLNTINDDDYVMLNSRGRQMAKESVNAMLKKFSEKYGIPKEVMHAHAFRHFFAIEFLKRNSNIALLADVLGHGSVNVTQLYLRQSQQQQKEAIDEAVNW
ncbi:tyrosine-type recombinase/integrase [uncultured Ruminococcus sp.]|uniref:tyrosine-type recombinase/integrase n=1 Tax=uncultured Ruminococcus sp. TaxID=165186 RepID=UPI0025E08ED9|nr:tyrosine-type recombinase/integrase [uncultured Ruminococcus sp.]